MIENADEEQVRSDPPPLTTNGIFPARSIEDIYCSYSDAVYDECTSQSIEESIAMPDAVYEECATLPVKGDPTVSNVRGGAMHGLLSDLHVHFEGFTQNGLKIRPNSKF